MIAKTKVLSKKELARKQGISRSSLYYQSKMESKDWWLKNRIELVLRDNPSYGHKRIAPELGANKKRVLRVMKKFGIKPYRRRGRKFKNTKKIARTYPNLLQLIPFPNRANIAWVSDFTQWSFHGQAVFLATVMDIFNRQVVGWCLLTTHAVQLPLTALINAIEKYGRPQILHSDQGSEYTGRIYTAFTESLGIRLSMSKKGSPWENCYQESFYSQFKVDLGDLNRFKTLGELAVAVYRQIYYYNNQRIHSKLKMPPALFAERQPILTTNYLSIKV